MKKTLYKLVGKVKKLFRAQKLKKEIPLRISGLIIRNATELTSLMIDRAYLHDDEVPFISKYALQADKVIVEIGCAFGGSSALLLLHSQPQTQVFSIDPFVTDSMAAFRSAQEKCQANVHQVLSSANKESLLSKWTLIPDYSYNVVKTWDKQIDMIFIDGDHNYDAVKQDFLEWLPHVKSGGIIIFHDSRKILGTPESTFNQGWPGPTKLVNELMTDSRITFEGNAYSMSAFKKI